VSGTGGSAGLAGVASGAPDTLDVMPRNLRRMLTIPLVCRVGGPTRRSTSMRARPLATAAVGACLLLGLTGCEKPTPGVTVSSGAKSVYVESATYCRDGQSPEKQNCVEHPDRVGIIKVKTGNAVAIDVDKAIAKKGWILVDADASARSEVQDEHYFSYTPDFRNGPIVHLEIRSLDKVADDAQTTGIWKFQLVQD
jgi:hypothetical protein